MSFTDPGYAKIAAAQNPAWSDSPNPPALSDKVALLAETQEHTYHTLQEILSRLGIPPSPQPPTGGERAMPSGLLGIFDSVNNRAQTMRDLAVQILQSI